MMKLEPRQPLRKVGRTQQQTTSNNKYITNQEHQQETNKETSKQRNKTTNKQTTQKYGWFGDAFRCLLSMICVVIIVIIIVIVTVIIIIVIVIVISVRVIVIVIVIIFIVNHGQYINKQHRTTTAWMIMTMTLTTSIRKHDDDHTDNHN